MSFATPIALILLISIPFVLYLGWPRMRFRRSRDIASLVLRTVIVLCLVLALAGAQVARSADRLAVVFLVDVSDSVGQAAREAELDYVRQALPRMGPDDLAGVVLFGAKAVVERPLSNVRELGPVQSTPPSGNTNLAEAVRLALGMFSADTARRIVVLSDGRPTLGDTQAAGELASATGVEISYVAFQPSPAPEVQVASVNVPSTVNAGQDFDLSLTIQSQANTPATITVFESGTIIHQQDVELRQGTNNYTLSLKGGNSGFKDFQVKVDPKSGDVFYQNNQLSAFSRVTGPPRALLISDKPDDSRYVLAALQQAGLTVDTVQPEQLAMNVVSLAQYNSIIMTNVSALQLSTAQMRALQSFVRDLGGGLVVVGGPDSYGPGGYFQTPLEETLPLDMQVKDQKRLPQLTIAYVIDRSGSMGVPGPDGVENIELAKEAIIRSINFLQANDRAGVVSFDTLGYWIANLQDVRDKLALQRLVASLRTGGGTDILAGMNLVAQDIVNDPSTRKHIILLTDGGASPAGLVELSRDLYQKNGVTTSVIAIGTDIPQFLSDMAKAGGGNFHQVEKVAQIPTIFTQETVLATRSYILEQSFVPSLTANSPIMNGITSAPPLLGYVATSPKQTAQVILTGPGPYNDPILAAWQYGLGRSVAFTSDATARWGANWVSWDAFVRFWSQAVRWTITEGKNNNVEARIVMEGDQARMIVDARDADGAFLNGLNMQLSVVDPAAKNNLLSLRQVAPGRYEATFTPGAEGAYLLHLRGGEGDNVIDQTSGWVMSYSSEYNIDQQNDGEPLLANLASLTGGRSLKEDTDAVFSHNLLSRTAATPIWPWLMLVALVLLPVDIAVRRLVITRTDIIRLRQAIAGRRAATVPSERLSTLMGAKERGRQRAEESGSALPKTGASGAAAVEEPKPDKPRYSGGKPQNTPDSNVAGQLLKKRKERQGD
jgi:uncharacterized membrane protein